MKNSFVWLIFLILLDQLIYYLSNSLVSQEILFSAFSTYLDEETALSMAEKSQSAARLLSKHVLHGIMTLVKLGGIVAVIYTGNFLAHTKLGFAVIFNTTIKFYPLFLITGIVQFLYFSFIMNEYSYTELNKFNPFSFYVILSVILPEHNLDLLKALSLLDLFFIFLVSKALSQLNEGCKERIILVTTTSYLTALILLRIVIGVIRFSI
jgi:hypothetical protein